MKDEHVYWCRSRKPDADTLPANGLVRFERYAFRQYEPSVDAMVCGYAVYDRVLEPWEIVRFGLISEPIE